MQFIWQNQYFNSKHLTTTEGEEIHIIQAGSVNHHQGPDFLNARIRIGQETWVGNIELHVHASSWMEHGHSEDHLYDNVILHVVWQEDKKLPLSFPALELQGRVSGILLNKYQALMQSPQFIPCQDQIQNVDDITLNTWMQRLLIERLDNRARMIRLLLESNHFHWEETFWWLLASGFGSKVNSEAFLKIAQSLPFSILMKHRNQIHQVEALLLGQAGILDTRFAEKYPAMLQQEYHFLAKKYRLKKSHFPLYYLRMRPANFPTVRLAQLAAFLNKADHFFNRVIETENLAEIEKALNIQANDYWHYHYLPGHPATFMIKKLGREMIRNILINTIIPVVYAYGLVQQSDKILRKALRWMESLPAEKNIIVRRFEDFCIASKTAFDSQALIQLKNEYCNNKRCLDCAIGSKLLYP